MIFESLVRVLIVMTDVLVFVNAFVLGEKTTGIETRSLRTGAKHLKIQGGEDVDLLRIGCSPNRPESGFWSELPGTRWYPANSFYT